jgi:uncharacterized protein (UPF0332 family)
LATEPERYLRKARESLASAQADVRGKRYNSAANRAYYASFQAAVAALISQDIRPERNWEHHFVAGQFSGKLIWRRKVFSAEFKDTLSELFDVRIDADYGPDPVSATKSERSVRTAERFLKGVEDTLAGKALKEPTAIYGEATIPARKKPVDYVDLIENKILETYPDLDFEIIKLKPREFTLRIFGDLEDMWDVQDAAGGLQSDILVQHDVWIHLSPKRRHPEDD